MTREELLALEYNDIPIEVCEAAYKTVKAKRYATVLCATSDATFLEWITASGIRQVSSGRAQFGFVDMTCDNPLRYVPFVSKEIAFYGISPQPLRAYFNQVTHYEKWMTAEVPLGDGLFIAVKIKS